MPFPRGPLEDAHAYSPLRSTAVSGLRALKPDARGSDPSSSSQDLGGSSVQPHSVCSSLEQASSHPPGAAGRLRPSVASARALRGWQGGRGQRAWPPPLHPSRSHLPRRERSCHPHLESASATTGRPVLGESGPRARQRAAGVLCCLLSGHGGMGCY